MQVVLVLLVVRSGFVVSGIWVEASRTSIVAVVLCETTRNPDTPAVVWVMESRLRYTGLSDM